MARAALQWGSGSATRLDVMEEATAYPLLEIPVYRRVDEPVQAFAYGCFMSGDDIILALYAVGAIFPVVTLLASMFGRRGGGSI